MHIGATLRLLRTGAGVGLRELASRVGVSSTYLSRVESGVDPTPTPERLAAIALELGVPPALLIEAGGRVSAYVGSYLEEVPAASALFLEIARRRLTPSQISRLRAILDEEAPVVRTRGEAVARPLAQLLDEDGVVTGVVCRRLTDAIDVLAPRLQVSGSPAAEVAQALHDCGDEAALPIGNGVSVLPVLVTGRPRAALATLAKPLRLPTPDQLPLRVLVAIADNHRGPEHVATLARIARLAARGLSERVADATSAREVTRALAELDIE